MKVKSKPIARAEIRERVEKKLRARGAVHFHGVALLLGTVVFLWNLPMYWANRFVNWDSGFEVAIVLYGILIVSLALHFIYYHFKHGAGYERHEAETASRINRELRRADMEEAEEREALIALEQNGKLKNRRLLWQHASLFLGLSATMIAVRWIEAVRYEWYDEYALLGVMYLVGAWAMALIAHALRYYFSYSGYSERRQARIDAEVAREMAKLGARRSGAPPGRRLASGYDAGDAISAYRADDIESGQSRSRA